MQIKLLLKKHQLKYSPLREIVIDILKNHKKPITPPDLLEKIQAKIHINKTSLYRQLETLTKAGIINKVILDTNVAYYEISTHHHHHMQCNNCQAIQCVTDDKLEKSIHQLEKRLTKMGITINNHHFSIDGLCKKCS